MSARHFFPILLAGLLALAPSALATPLTPQPSPLVPPSTPLRFEEHHVTLALPAGWSHLDRELLAQINAAARSNPSPVAISYFDAMVPDEQPPGSPVYILFQWDPRITSADTPAAVEAVIRRNVAEAARTTVAPAPQIISDPAFDWPRSRITFRTAQNSTGAALITDTTGVVGAAGILWIHCYAPEHHFGTYQPAFRALADSATFDPAYTYVPPPLPPLNPPHRSSPIAPLVGGPLAVALLAGAIILWLRLRSRA